MLIECEFDWVWIGPVRMGAKEWTLRHEEDSMFGDYQPKSIEGASVNFVDPDENTFCSGEILEVEETNIDEFIENIPDKYPDSNRSELVEAMNGYYEATITPYSTLYAVNFETQVVRGDYSY